MRRTEPWGRERKNSVKPDSFGPGTIMVKQGAAIRVGERQMGPRVRDGVTMPHFKRGVDGDPYDPDTEELLRPDDEMHV